MQSPETMKKLREQDSTPTGKDWYDLNDVVARNTEEEILREIYGDGYIAKLNALIAARDAALAAEEEEKSARRLALRAAKKLAEEAVKKMAAEEHSR